MKTKTKLHSRRSAFWTHMIRFLMYNFVGALLPLAISYVIRQVADIPALPGVYAPELLFFAIMISATALGDITDEAKMVGKAPVFQLIRGALLFGSLGVASIYGMNQFDSIVGPGNINFRNNITNLTLICALTLFVTSLLAETLIAKIRG